MASRRRVVPIVAFVILPCSVFVTMLSLLIAGNNKFHAESQWQQCEQQFGNGLGAYYINDLASFMQPKGANSYTDITYGIWYDAWYSGHGFVVGRVASVELFTHSRSIIGEYVLLAFNDSSSKWIVVQVGGTWTEIEQLLQEYKVPPPLSPPTRCR
jgi:hypothetical protein